MGHREAENTRLVQRWFEEVWNQGREDLIEELRAPDTVATGLGETAGPVRGLPSFRTFYQNLRATFPDLRVDVEQAVAEGDMVVVRLTITGTHIGEGMGIAPTGKQVSFSGMVMARIHDGKIAESWNNLDQLGLLRQMGVVEEAGLDRFLTAR